MPSKARVEGHPTGDGLSDLGRHEAPSRSWPPWERAAARLPVSSIGSVTNAFWLAGALGIVALGSVGAWIISIIGAVVLLAILKASNIYK